MIFSELDIEEILAIRTTCSIFASVGLDYLGNEVPLVFHREKFRILTEIAKHSKLSKQMRSLFYTDLSLRAMKIGTGVGPIQNRTRNGNMTEMQNSTPSAIFVQAFETERSITSSVGSEKQLCLKAIAGRPMRNSAHCVRI